MATILLGFVPLALVLNPVSETKLFGDPTWTALFFTFIIAVVSFNIWCHITGKEVSNLGECFVLLCATICNPVSMRIYVTRFKEGKDSLKLFEVTLMVWTISCADIGIRFYDLFCWLLRPWWTRRADANDPVLPISSRQQGQEQDIPLSSPNIQATEASTSREEEPYDESGVGDESSRSETTRLGHFSSQLISEIHIAYSRKWNRNIPHTKLKVRYDSLRQRI